MKVQKRILRCLAFLLVLVLVLCHLHGIFGLSDYFLYESKTAFQKEVLNRLDGVYIGGSDVYYFWQPLFGWLDHGIAIWNYSSNSMKPSAVKYYLAEAEKRQPDALFIISLNTLKYDNSTGINYTDLHRAVDYMPLSANTFEMTHELLERSEYTGFDRMEFYLPIIRFHSAWDSLEPWAFGASDANYKSSLSVNSFFNTNKDVTGQFNVYDSTQDASDDMQAIVDDLLDYCDAHQLNVLFIKVPQSMTKKQQGRINAIKSMVIERGYPCLDLFDQDSEIGIDLREECMDYHHTNIHGSLKFSKTLGDYLVEQYHFEDKRGLSSWADWDESASQYTELISQYTLPFEREHAQRVITDIPVLGKPVVNGQSIKIKWEFGNDDVDGFIVYRKCAAGKTIAWQESARVSNDKRSWTDKGLKPLTRYTYTVVPYRMEDGETVYGSFKVFGVSVETEEKA